MIVGIVQGREALIRLTIRGFRGRLQEIEAVVDSGYTGWLTLPPGTIASLNLRWQSFGRGILADGSVSTSRPRSCCIPPDCLISRSVIRDRVVVVPPEPIG
jgi:predicted aspartyl protease